MVYLESRISMKAYLTWTILKTRRELNHFFSCHLETLARLARRLAGLAFPTLLTLPLALLVSARARSLPGVAAFSVELLVNLEEVHYRASWEAIVFRIKLAAMFLIAAQARERLAKEVGGAIWCTSTPRSEANKVCPRIFIALTASQSLTDL